MTHGNCGSARENLKYKVSGPQNWCVCVHLFVYLCVYEAVLPNCMILQNRVQRVNKCKCGNVSLTIYTHIYIHTQPIFNKAVKTSCFCPKSRTKEGYSRGIFLGAGLFSASQCMQSCIFIGVLRLEERINLHIFSDEKVNITRCFKRLCPLVYVGIALEMCLIYGERKYFN